MYVKLLLVGFFPNFVLHCWTFFLAFFLVFFEHLLNSLLHSLRFLAGGCFGFLSIRELHAKTIWGTKGRAADGPLAKQNLLPGKADKSTSDIKLCRQSIRNFVWKAKVNSYDMCIVRHWVQSFFYAALIRHKYSSSFIIKFLKWTSEVQLIHFLEGGSICQTARSMERSIFFFLKSHISAPGAQNSPIFFS